MRAYLLPALIAAAVGSADPAGAASSGPSAVQSDPGTPSNNAATALPGANPSDKLERSSGVIPAPAGVDPGMVERPPATSSAMPVIPPSTQPTHGNGKLDDETRKGAPVDPK